MLFVSRHPYKSRVGTATNNTIKDSILRLTLPTLP